MTSPARNTVQLLDVFRLSDGEGCDFGLPSGARRLIAYLALSDGAMPRSYVASQLWVDSSERAAQGSLRSALWNLRQLGCEVVEATRETVSLSEDVNVDLRDITDRAQTIVRSESCPRNHIAAEDFTRSLLPDWYDDWVLFERERVRQLFLHALEKVAACLSQAGRFAEAIDTSLSAIQMEPLRESSWRVLMEIHMAEGNRAEALRQYRTLSRILNTELGFGPSEGLAEFAAQIGS